MIPVSSVKRTQSNVTVQTPQCQKCQIKKYITAALRVPDRLINEQSFSIDSLQSYSIG